MPLMRVLGSSGRVILANPRIGRVAGTWGLWITGEWAFLVLLSVNAFDRGGTSAVAAVGVVRLIPGALAAPLLSVVTDRFSRVRVIVAVLVSWTVLVAIVPVVLRSTSLLPMYLVVGAASVAATMLRPAVSALIPQVVDEPHELTCANSAYSLLEAAGSLVGPLLAGLLVSFASTTTRYSVVAGVFVCGAVLCARTRTDFTPPDQAPASIGRRLLEPLLGFPALVRPPRLLAVVGVVLAQTATRGIINVVVVAAAVSLLHTGLTSTGVLFAAVGAGGLVGAVLTLAGAGLRPGLPFIVGMSMWGLPLMLIAAAPHFAITMIALALVGVGNAIGDVYGLTLLHRMIPDHVLGRAFGAFWGAASAAGAAGSLAAPGLIHVFGLRRAIFVAGIAMLTVVGLSWLGVHRIDRDLAVDENSVAVLRECTLFRPLTRVAIEQIARRVHGIDVSSGATVLAAGDLTETFYVVDHGELDVVIDGEIVDHLGRGDCFGEVAALHHVPRGATITAVAPSRLLTLGGADFVVAVTGHRAAEHATHSLISYRLARGVAEASRSRTRDALALGGLRTGLVHGRVVTTRMTKREKP